MGIGCDLHLVVMDIGCDKPENRALWVCAVCAWDVHVASKAPPGSMKVHAADVSRDTETDNAGRPTIPGDGVVSGATGREPCAKR